MNFTVSLPLILVLVGMLGLLAIGCVRKMLHFRSQYAEYGQKMSQTKYLEHLIKYTTDVICLFDENLNIIAFNDHSLKVYGYSRDEFTKMNIIKVRTSESVTNIYEQLNQVTENSSYLYETTHQRKDGSTFPVEVIARLLIIDQKRYYHTVSHDTTAEKKTMEEMKKLSRAIEQSPTSIIITNIQGEIEYVNPKYSSLTGYSLDETLGQNPRILNSGINPKQVFESLWQTILAGKEWSGEFHNRKKNGEIYIESAVISPITDENGSITHFVAVKEDITEKKNSFEQLIKAKEKAEESDKLKSAFLSNMSHEIRTPMNAIIGFTEILLKPDLSQAKKERFTALIKQRSFDLLRIIEDILDISRIEIGQMKTIETEMPPHRKK